MINKEESKKHFTKKLSTHEQSHLPIKNFSKIDSIPIKLFDDQIVRSLETLCVEHNEAGKSNYLKLN
jgi:hypothetical protein